VNVKELGDAISAAVEGRSPVLSSKRAAKTDEPLPSTASLVPWNVSAALERLGGDENLLREVVQIFLAETPRKIAALREAIGQPNAELVGRLAHSLKGELGYLGLAEASQKARDLEEMGKKNDLHRAATVFAALEAELTAALDSMRSVCDPEMGRATASGKSK
jgi:HPt (histidine-containing phosphotransfer) domain-containing protein